MNKTLLKKHSTRPVEKSDLDLLFVMLKDLVNHEGLAERLKMTRLRLEEELFGPKKRDFVDIFSIQIKDILHRYGVGS